MRAQGLDGIRAFAVLAITAYHLRFIEGGLLSVSVFFTLSGYLITSILLRDKGIDLKSFWIRRARRLLPAVLLLLVVVLSATAIARPGQLSAYLRQAFAASAYFANWATIARGDNYFNRFDGPGPFDHLWSLSIEEQFYAAWPMLLLSLLALGKRRLGKRRRALAIIVTGALAVASALAMAFHYAPTAINNTRAYEGTDTRAAPILIGAVAAMILPLEEVARARRVVLDVLGALAAAALVMIVGRVHEDSPLLYRGADSLVGVATAVLVIAAAHPSTVVGRLLGVAPLRWIGQRSYGIYLWHMPVVAFVPMTMLARHPYVRGGFQLAMIICLAATSWAVLEDPIRRNQTSLPKATALAVPIATIALVPWLLLSPATASQFEAMAVRITDDEAPPPLPQQKSALLTSCTHLVHIGDSTSLALTFKSILPAPEDRLDAQYRSVGVRHFTAEISGGRAIVEKMKDEPSAYEVVSLKSSTGHLGEHSCYVLALGNGDSATVRGNVEALGKRIDWMMRVASGARVLWTTTKTLSSKGAYRNAYMEGWNQALIAACARYRNMRVYDWAAEVRDEWFLPDEIHPNAVGARERASRLARALAVAFPGDGAASSECVIRSSP